ncbi:proline dehydrogenase [Aureococcus anophagefferens]|nr:proline dehydrogenase [Aureococcus anophagefferens]
MAMHSRRAVSLLRRAAPSVARPMHSRRAVSLLRRAGPSVVRPASTLPLPGDGAGGRLRFDDARLAFDGVPTADLVRALCVFQACGVGPLVAHGERLLAAAPRPRRPRVAAVVRPTFFAHFVAGEDEAESAAPRARAQARRCVADVISVKRMRELSALCREAGPFAAAALTEEEGALADAMLDRLSGLAALARRGVRVMVGAEHTYFQPAIDHICLELMRKYNRGGGAVVHNTYQCYLTATAAARRHAAREPRGWRRAKLVRGAYLHLARARARARLRGPVHATIEDTHACFDAAVYFGQLLGMADHLTFTLSADAAPGPYGAVVVRRLLRRAHGSNDLSSNVAGERAPRRRARAPRQRRARGRANAGP